MKKVNTIIVIVLIIATVTLVALMIIRGNETPAADIPDGAAYLDGCYKNDTLNVVYVFRPDFNGVMMIGDTDETTYLLHYYVMGTRIYIENYMFEVGSFMPFTFIKTENSIIMDGVEYVEVELAEQ